MIRALAVLALLAGCAPSPAEQAKQDAAYCRALIDAWPAQWDHNRGYLQCILARARG